MAVAYYRRQHRRMVVIILRYVARTTSRSSGSPFLKVDYESRCL